MRQFASRVLPRGCLGFPTVVASRLSDPSLLTLAVGSAPTCTSGPTGQQFRLMSTMLDPLPVPKGIGLPLEADSSTSSSSSSVRGKRYITNPFNGSKLSKDGTLMSSLHQVGIGSNDEGHLIVENPTRLDQYAKLIRTGLALTPLVWKGAMKQELEKILLNPEVTTPSAEVGKLLELLQRGEGQPNQYDPKKIRATRSSISGGYTVVHKTKGMMAGVVGGTEGDALEDQEIEIALNDEQQKVVDLALEGYNLYIGGQAGTGKTVVLRAIRRALRRAGCRVAMTATTGIAGCHIDGCTFHFAFGCTANGEFSKASCLKAYDVIVIDEISMMSAELFLKLDELLKIALGNSNPFGGVQIITCGDFLQLTATDSVPLFRLPYFREHFLTVKLSRQVRQDHVEYANQLASIRLGIVPPDLQKTVKHLPLTAKVPGAVYLMPRNDSVFAMNQEELLKLPGDIINYTPAMQTPSLSGEWSSTVLIHTSPAFDETKFRNHLLSRLNERAPVLPNELSLYSIASDGYVFRVKMPERTQLEKRFAVKDAVDAVLKELEHLLDAESKVLNVGGAPEETMTQDVDELLSKNMDKHPVIKPLNLKIGARVLLRANLSPKFVNGSIGVVEKLVPCSMEHLPGFLSASPEMAERTQGVLNAFQQHTIYSGQEVPTLPVVRFGEAISDVITIPPWRFSVGGTEMTNYFEQSAVCIPLSLAYAFTVHKVQGLTLRGKVHIKLENMFRCEHLMYVGMSRVKHPDQLTIAGFSPDMVIADPTAVEFDQSIPGTDRLQVPRATFVAEWKMAQTRIRETIEEKKLRHLVSKTQQQRRHDNRSTVIDVPTSFPSTTIGTVTEIEV